MERKKCVICGERVNLFSARAILCSSPACRNKRYSEKRHGNLVALTPEESAAFRVANRIKRIMRDTRRQTGSSSSNAARSRA